MKATEQTVALDLLRRHPGWSDPRVAEELRKRDLSASPSSVHAWRVDAGLAPHTQSVARYPPPRLPGVRLECGHLVHPEKLQPHGRAGHCDYCGATATVTNR